MIRLFLADDVAAVREVMRLGLQERGGRFLVVGEAADGSSALERIAATGPDVIILDVEMPRLTGLDVVRTLRGQGDCTPVILCSGSEAELPEQLPDTVVGRLRKPFRLEQLVEAVEQAASRLSRVS